MEELKINIPEGYCIDEENSTFECIKFKPKELTYTDVAKELFKNGSYYIDGGADIRYRNDKFYTEFKNNAMSEKQCKKLLAINQLMNVARYLNNGWKPDLKSLEHKYYLTLNSNDYIVVLLSSSFHSEIVYFKSEELAERAIKILGEETIKLSLSTDW